MQRREHTSPQATVTVTDDNVTSLSLIGGENSVARPASSESVCSAGQLIRPKSAFVVRISTPRFSESEYACPLASTPSYPPNLRSICHSQTREDPRKQRFSPACRVVHIDEGRFVI